MGKRPGYLTAYANHAGISKPAAAEQLKRVGIDYLQPFDFAEADKRREAARHADRAPFAKPIYVQPGESPRDPEETSDSDAPGPKDPTYAQHQAKREKFKAKLAELDYLERISTLVRREAVETESFRVARLVRDAILNVPARLAGILAAETDQRRVHDLLESELRQALEALAGDDTKGTAAA
jgi:hypothetical protein